MGLEVLQHQLFRYAQDLQDLMEQQSQLQQRYKMVLQSVGRNVPDDNLLAELLLNAAQVHVVTDLRGIVKRVGGSRADEILDLPGRDPRGMRVDQWLEQAQRDGCGLGILHLDIDGFKAISDELGYAVGDQVRQEVAARLKALEQYNLSVAQLGGEEFVMLLSGSNDDEEIESLAYAVLCTLAQPFQLSQHTLSVTANIGCARYPQDGDSMAALLKNADAAMFAAKRFDTHFCFYETGASREAWVERN